MMKRNGNPSGGKGRSGKPGRPGSGPARSGQKPSSGKGPKRSGGRPNKLQGKPGSAPRSASNVKSNRPVARTRNPQTAGDWNPMTDMRVRQSVADDQPAMSIEERKAAQLAKWRKELGLEDDDAGDDTT